MIFKKEKHMTSKPQRKQTNLQANQNTLNFNFIQNETNIQLTCYLLHSHFN